jgi:hypothetical protein
MRSLVHELAAEGHPKAEIYNALEQLLVQLRARPDARNIDEDAVLDVMDALTGWCRPDAELLPDR